LTKWPSGLVAQQRNWLRRLKRGVGVNKSTAAQKRAFSKAVEFGCLPCYLDGNPGTPAGISHCHEAGYRNHNCFWPSCEAHHLEQHAVPGIPNRHKNPIEFRDKYGTDAELSALCVELILETV
jgi:hypothetical protein